MSAVRRGLTCGDARLGRSVLAAAAEYKLELRAEWQAEGIAAAQRRQEQGRMLPGKKHIGRLRSARWSWPGCADWSPTA
jgi:hypothetical protein